MRTRRHWNVLSITVIVVFTFTAALFAQRRVPPQQAMTGEILPGKKAYTGKYPMPDIEVQPGLTAQQLWEKLHTDTLPAGVTILSITYTGASIASGSYKYMPPLAGVQLKDGIVLTSGEANDVGGLNFISGISKDNGAPGDADLQAAATSPASPNPTTYNASLLTIEFTSDTSIKGVSFDFAYGTDEYPEFVNSIYNDVFCTFLDNKNICFDTVGNLISVNNNFFKIDNNVGTMTLNMQYDGFTLALRTSAAVSEGRHTLKFAICDIGDPYYDSGVFLSNFKFKLGPIGTHPITGYFDDQAFAVPENSPGGTFVGKLAVKVPDTSNVKFSLMTSVPEFLLDGDNGVITVANGANLDYEAQNQYTFKVRSMYRDSFPDTANITVNILDEDWGDLIDDQIFSVPEHSPGGTFVGTVQVLLPDSLPVTVSELQGVPEFDFDQTTRGITVANGAVLDVDIQDRYYITLLAKAKEAKDDTATMTIIITAQYKISVDEGFYYDNDADGYIDSIYVSVTTDVDPLTDDYVQVVVDSAISLPDFRDFTVTGSGAVTGGFYITVTEDTGHDPVTWVTQDDKLTVKGYVFPDGEELTAGTAPLFDRVAPIIHWAPKSALLRHYQVASKSDTLGVRFSEPVQNATASEPFYFLDPDNGSNYSVTLIPASQPEPDSMVFHVETVSGVAEMEEGDSLWIHETDLVTDTEGNSQNNTGNIKRKLYVEKVSGSVEIAKAYYFDRTADGYVDSVYVEATTSIEGGITATHVSELVDNAITFPDFRDFSATGSGLSSGGFYIIVSEDKGHNPFTYVTGDDKLQIRDYTFTTGGTVNAKSVVIYDRVAPIIHWADKAAFLLDYMIDTISDTLTVRFSEPVERVTSDEPFYFLDEDNNTNYTVKLSCVSQPDPDKMVFYVTSLNGVDYMEEGDSLWIKETDRVSDLEGNFQNNNKNTRRKLYVRRKIIPYELIPNSVTPIDLNNIQMYTIPQNIIDVLIDQGILSDLHLQIFNGVYTGMIITVVPNPDNIGDFLPDFELKGEISIFDPVGNQIRARSRMAWWEANKCLVWVWNMKNENNRNVGPGAYLAIMEIEDVTESLGYQNGGPKQTKKTFLGVRE